MIVRSCAIRMAECLLTLYKRHFDLAFSYANLEERYLESHAILRSLLVYVFSVGLAGTSQRCFHVYL